MKEKIILENKKKYDEIFRESLTVKIKSLNELNSTNNKRQKNGPEYQVSCLMLGITRNCPMDNLIK